MRAPLMRKISTTSVASAIVLAVCIAPGLWQWWSSDAVDSRERPDAFYRPAHEHRQHVLDTHDFVERYSALAYTHKDADERYGWDADFSMRHGSITRCATSQYAMIAYFCGREAAHTDKAHRLGHHTLAALQQHVREVALREGPAPEYVFRCNLHQASDPDVGHTFAVHALPDGQYQVYQSFIGHYSLAHYLRTHGPMNTTQFSEFLDNIRLIVNARYWGAAEDKAYKTNFMVSLMGGGKFDVPASGLAALFNDGSSTYDAVQFAVDLVCDARDPPVRAR